MGADDGGVRRPILREADLEVVAAVPLSGSVRRPSQGSLQQSEGEVEVTSLICDLSHRRRHSRSQTVTRKHSGRCWSDSARRERLQLWLRRRSGQPRIMSEAKRSGTTRACRTGRTEQRQAAAVHFLLAPCLCLCVCYLSLIICLLCISHFTGSGGEGSRRTSRGARTRAAAAAAAAAAARAGACGQGRGRAAGAAAGHTV